MNLLNAVIELYELVAKNDLDDRLSDDTLEVINQAQTYFETDPGQNLVICLSDQETYDVSGYLIFVDERELEEITDCGYIPEIVGEERWITIGD